MAKGTIGTDKEDSSSPPELHKFENSLGSTSARDEAEGKRLCEKGPWLPSRGTWDAGLVGT